MIAEAVGLLLIGAGIVRLVIWLNRLDPEDLGSASPETQRRLK